MKVTWAKQKVRKANQQEHEEEELGGCEHREWREREEEQDGKAREPLEKKTQEKD